VAAVTLALYARRPGGGPKCKGPRLTVHGAAAPASHGPGSEAEGQAPGRPPSGSPQFCLGYGESVRDPIRSRSSFVRARVSDMEVTILYYWTWYWSSLTCRLGM
jgi:hypothetical protein